MLVIQLLDGMLVIGQLVDGQLVEGQLVEGQLFIGQLFMLIEGSNGIIDIGYDIAEFVKFDEKE